MNSENIKNIVEPILNAEGLFLVDLTVSKDNFIEILIDSMKGVNLQTCIHVSKKVEQHLNREEEDFQLTVSSAGIGYPFKVEAQYLKNIGNTVEILLKDNTQLTGILKTLGQDTLTLEYEEKKKIEGKKKKEIVKIEKEINRADIKQIKDTVKF